MEAAVQFLELERIVPSKTNPRAAINGPAFNELLVSVKTRGVLQPILVRPREYKRKGESGTFDGFEVVAGHRRFEAARQAGLETIPAMIRELDDDAALEVQLIENLMRSDLHPLEEAEGYAQLMAHGKHDAAHLAARIGRSVKYVYDRVKLAQLIPEAKNAFLREKFTAGHAILLARLTPKEQKRAMDDGALFQHEHLLFDPDFDRPERKGDDRLKGLKPVTVREFSDWIDRNVRFDPKEPDPILFPETAAELADAEKVVAITFEHYTPEEARDQKARTYHRASWKRADGKEKSKACDYAVTGFVAAGRRRGEAFKVCVNRDKCTTHWGAEVRRKKQRAKSQGQQNEAAGRRQIARSQEDPKLRAALDKAREEAIEQINGAVLKAVAAAKPEQVFRALAHCRTWIISDYLRETKGKGIPTRKAVMEWTRKAPLVEIMQALVFAELQEDDLIAQDFGVDTGAIGKAAEKRARESLKSGVQSSAQPELSPGTCRECGCTETTPCITGGQPCAWADRARTLCSNPKCLAKAAKKGVRINADGYEIPKKAAPAKKGKKK